MVDNKDNQWEDMEYTEDNVAEDETLEYEDENSYEDDGSSEQDENQEYEEYEDGEYEGDEEEYEEDDEEPEKKKSPIIPIALLLVLLIAAGAIAIPKLTANKNDTDNTAFVNQQQVQDNNQQQENGEGDGNQNTDDLAGQFFDEAGGEETNNMMSVNFNEENNETNVVTGQNENGEQQVATVSEAQPEHHSANEADLFESHTNNDQNDTDSIMVTYNKAVRMNPFKPPVVTSSGVAPYEVINNTQFEIIEPPTASIHDENLTRLLQTQISGILYDNESPSAIVNLNGMDQFVKIGDVISGYKIQNITKDKVQITYKNNSYVASVGELFSKGSLEQQQSVANLENKFAGRYKNKH